MFEGWDGSVARAGSPDGAAAALAATTPVMAQPLEDAERAYACGRLAATRLVQSSDRELTDRLAQLDHLRLAMEQVTVPVLVEAIGRGLPGEQGLSARDWVATHCPWMSRPEISDLVTVAEDDNSFHAPVRQALTECRIPVRRAARVLRALGRVAPAINDPEVYAKDVEILLGVASKPDYTDVDLKRVTDKLIDVALPEKEADYRARAAREMRSVNESSLADGTLTRFVITCEAEGAALLRQVLQSPLAAPAPDAQGPDPRTATQRRYDALMTMLSRGVGAPQGSPGTAKAKLVLTVSWDALTGALQGSGHALTGESLSPSTVRKLACSADLVPMILGKDGETIETVRPTRFATETQQLALWKRDKHCTYPGCTVPPQWCDAHHIIWWSRGGKTYLLNLALLCGRHHTIVHDRNLTAEVTAHGVTWHL